MAGLLAHSPADVLRSLMVQLGLGTMPTTSGAWPIAVARERDKPTETMTVYDTTGNYEGRTHPDTEAQEQYGFQIRVRAQRPDEGYARSQLVAVTLDSAYNVSVSVGLATYEVAGTTRRGGVIPLGKETPQSERSLFTLNGVIALRQLS